jgi:cyclase
VEKLGAGEIVLNCMNQDGVRKGYDLEQVSLLCDNVSIPVIASGGAGSEVDFVNLFKKTKASGGLAASIFHKNIVTIKKLKDTLIKKGVEIRKC